MSDVQTPMASNEALIYQITIEGHLSQMWAIKFDGLTITYQDSESILTGPVIDQAALHGLLRKIRDLGMPLISVQRLSNST